MYGRPSAESGVHIPHATLTTSDELSDVVSPFSQIRSGGVASESPCLRSQSWLGLDWAFQPVPPHICGVFVQSKTKSVTWRVVAFLPTAQDSQADSERHHPAHRHAMLPLVTQHRSPLLALNPGILFSLPGGLWVQHLQ